jgi:hypothetical protein
MPYSDDGKHSPSEFYYPDEISDETNDPNGIDLKAKTPNKTTTKTAKKKLKTIYTQPESENHNNENEKRHEGFSTLPGDS